ncbi:nucleolar GTP-binding protein 1 [Tieghemostelium lacteum]|uniref:Nucleolar GTP-binding protein 1 n=1 Tax=Tieghemostelium lacteum TaxID=361077 RepID=A0A151ZD63_TIELA|nr:nucleolar GTP-binding protein 1 [Tieghemostelium lacteum]|eukprot:KYQ91893.1 nucleolar GTP-binding protein 1 [Tieghemostelium lacteum]
MVLYNFKKIQVVPTSKDFIDIILSKTQRKTPTEIHKQYAIGRIRSFYMRKVKYTQQNYHDKLTQIINDFPLLDDIHPFYADLINVLYDKDHYKLALGQLNTARNLIDNLAKDYLRLLKYGDSLYRCKQLKRAALGRMCTLMLKQGPSLQYLEHVRQHLARLPSIDPNTRTLLLTGYPNVGKSSFMNKLTRANVDVQPYAFTTKSLFVGHTDFKYNVWQVIDSPGILDHPLDERNTIEMQSITALAHLHACVLFIIDISERCGYTIKQQVDLFFSIKTLFINKPLLIVLNKIDVRKPEDVPEDDWKLIQSLNDPARGGIGGTQVVPMSTLTEEGVSKVKDAACSVLFEDRVEKKLKSAKVENEIHRLHLALPTPRDKKSRPPIIPQSVLAERQKQYVNSRMDDGEDLLDDNEDDSKSKVQLTRAQLELLEEEEDNRLLSEGILPEFDLRAWKSKYLLKNDEWKFDIIPEIMDGKNISDYIDPEILAKLEQLEMEEEAFIEELKADGIDPDNDSESDLDEENIAYLDEIRQKKHELRVDHQIKGSSKPQLTRNTRGIDSKEMDRNLRRMGVEEEELEDIKSEVRARSKSRQGRKRDRSTERDASVSQERGISVNRSQSRSPSRTLPPTPGEGYRDLAQKLAAERIQKTHLRKRNKHGKKGEGDRHIYDLMPKHLFAGKLSGGTHDRR